MKRPAPYRTPAPRPVPDPEPQGPAEIGGLRRSHRALPLWRALWGAIFAGAFFVLFGALVALAANAVAFPFGLACAVVIFLFFGFRPLRERCTSVDVHADGLAIVRRDARDEIAFDDVDELWCRVEVNASVLGRVATINAIWLVDRAGRRHLVPLAVEASVELAQLVLRRCSDALLADALAAIREGETLTFAHVRISSSEIRVGRRRAAWSDVRLVRLQPGRVAFFRRFPVFPWAVVGWDAIPHPTVFTRVVATLASRVEVERALGAVSGDGAS